MGKTNAPARCDRRTAGGLTLSTVHAANEEIAS
jgi:hypothetical protein